MTKHLICATALELRRLSNLPKVTQQASGEACAGEREGREGVLGQWLEEGEVHVFI